MYQFLFVLFVWGSIGFIVTIAAGIKTGFWWFLFLGLPLSLVAGLMALAFVVTAVGAFIGFVSNRR